MRRPRRELTCSLLLLSMWACGKPAGSPRLAAPTPGDPESFLAAAHALQAEDRIGEAEKLLARGAEQFPQSPELAVERAKLLATLGRTAETVAVLKGLSQENPRVLSLLGYSEMMNGELDAGRAHLEAAIDRASSLGQPYAPAHYHLGLNFLSRGDLASARLQFEKATAASGTHLESRYQLMNVLERLNQSNAVAREEFAKLYEPQLRKEGALDDPPPESTVVVTHADDVEWHPRVVESRFVRSFPAGATIEVACHVDRASSAWFSAEVITGDGAGASLIDAIHAESSGESGIWVTHLIDLPPGPAGAQQSVEFRVGPQAGWARWLRRDPPVGAVFSEPLPLPNTAVSRSADPRPNILLISLDTLRADRLGSSGSGRATSPAIDALANSGVRFARAEAAGNWTLPSHYSMLSGLTPAAHGVMPDLDSTRGYLFPDRRLAVRGSGREEMLAENLSRAGYRTAAVTENGWVSGRFGFDQGFWVYRSDLRGSRDATIAAARAELEATGARGPWFLFVHTYAPHQPYHAPRELRTKFASKDHVGFAWPSARVPIRDYYRFRLDLFPPAPSDVAAFRNLYDGQVAYTDGLVQSLVDDLRGRGLLEQTVIVVTSDHGEEIFERGQFDHGDTLFEEVTHVPLVLSWPGRIPAGRTVEAPTSLTNLPATLLDLAGVATRLGQGESLKPVWSENAASRPAFAEAIGRRAEPVFAVWDGSLKYIRRETKRGRREALYDLSRDPNEINDLASTRPNDLARLRALVDAHLAASQQIHQALGTSEQELDSETIERLKSLGYAR